MLKVKSIIDNEIITIILLGIISVFYTGYYFTSCDLVFANTIRHLKDATFLSNDITADSQQRSIYFFRLMGYLSDFLPMSVLFFLCYFIKNILLCGGIYALAHSLTKNKNVALASIVAIYYVSSQTIPLNFEVVSATFTFSSLALAICFFSLALFIEKKHVLSFIILGLATNIHLIMCTQVLGIILLYLAINWRVVSWKTIWCGIFIYFVLASPELLNVVIFAVKNNRDSSVTFKDYFEIIACLRGPHELLPEAWPLEKYIRFAIFAVAGIYSYYNLKRKQEISSAGIAISLIVCVFCLMSVPFIHRSLPALMYLPFRMTIWIYAVMLIYIVNFLISAEGRDKKMIIWSILTFAFLNSPYLLCVLFLFRWYYGLIFLGEKKNIVFIILNGIFVVVLVYLKPLRFPIFGFSPIGSMVSSPFEAKDNFLFLFILVFGLINLFYVKRRQIVKNINLVLLSSIVLLTTLPVMNYLTEGKCRFIKRIQPEFQLRENDSSMQLYSWVKANTKKDDLFILPPYRGSSPFRYFAERAVLADFYTVVFSANRLKKWFDLLDVLSRGELTRNFKEILRRKDGYYTLEILKKNYWMLNANDFRRIGEKYDCHYVITEKSDEVSLNKVYGGQQYNIYKIQ